MKDVLLGEVKLGPNFANVFALVPSLNLAASNFAADCLRTWFSNETRPE